MKLSTAMRHAADFFAGARVASRQEFAVFSFLKNGSLLPACAQLGVDYREFTLHHWDAIGRASGEIGAKLCWNDNHMAPVSRSTYIKAAEILESEGL